ncbi:MAG TPA: glycine cleavage T C-terminal barrel domain-containing protein [Bryobacteraceae bacterium]|nr:glycine cleavage T C-terminal barrel domain-containing protein [Bryobacteraceae bacterium]
MNGYEGLRKAAAWIDLSARGKIRVTGEDRARLLHAMSTNHVQELATGEGLYTFFLNDKGRVLADAYVYNLGESLLLDTEPETAASLAAHLDKYIIADDAVIEDETGRWMAVGLEGPASAEAAAKLGISSPARACALVEWNGGFVVQVAETGMPGVRIFVPMDERHTLAARLTAAGIPNATAQEARVVRIENGKPRYSEDISDRYLAQETQQLHAIHFNKGCYLGQEIVERVRSRGQVHRHLTAVEMESAAPPAPGSKLVADGHAVAEITSAVYSPALGKTVGLAYVRTEAIEKRLPMTLEGSDPPVTAKLAVAQNSSVAV